MEILHNSRDLDYRIPFGAATTGTDILLSVKIKDTDSDKVYIEVRRDDRDKYKSFRIRSEDRESGVYSVKLKAPEDSCLIWYRFRVEEVIPDGGIRQVFCCNNEEGLGGEGRMVEISDNERPLAGLLDRSSEDVLTPFQITVYSKSEVPEWYKDGIVYQIFPDRFARDDRWRERCETAISRVNDRRSDTKRLIEDDWSKPAYYIRDDSNKVTGWPIYGGSLKGIEEKLDYLKSLGVSVIYLNPIFEATSNHRYDTGNYLKIDPALGTEEDFVHLAEEAKTRGIRIILDGVFSHTGQDSIYFDRFGNYGGEEKGAWQGEDSPYRSWYKFDENEKCGYRSWWGVEDLPEVDENNESYREFILGEGGPVKKWLNKGASGWRLDVADELPDDFIRAMRKSVKEEDEDALLIGEVWEDASNKISYGERKKYFAGDELDGTMHYPLRTILLDYINYTITAGKAGQKLMSLAENYPEENLYGALNLIGSHDRERIMTMMAAEEDRSSAVKKVKMLSTLQYALPGVPCVYYGDEAGLTGKADPVNRSAFPWGNEDQELEYHYRMLGLIYSEHPVLKTGNFCMLSGQDGITDDVFCFVRSERRARGEKVQAQGAGSERILVIVNRSYGESDVDLTNVQVSASSYAMQAGAHGSSKLRCGYALDLLSSEEVPVDEHGSLGVVHMESLSVKMICLLDEEPHKEKLGRDAGVICHVGSLGEEALGDKAKDFVDFVKSAGLGIWQVLPINPPGLGDSPYVSSSTFAGSPEFISRDVTLREASEIKKYDDFLRENDYWLTEYIAFTVIKELQGGLPWYEWPDEYKFADPHEAVARLISSKGERIRELQREQHLFYVEWQRLLDYAHSKGVKIMGDIPIYMSKDSADVWAHKDIFRIDEKGRLRVHAGVPPDGFSKDGQDWGNPLYDWDYLESTGFSWWLRRIRQCAERFDILRIDHFRGLSEYFAIPEGETPKSGMWQHGPGLRLIRAIRNMLKDEGLDLTLIAEDLGYLDAGVKNLLKLSGLPGMDIWQFSAWEMLDMPEGKAANRLFYTGTHDNNTLLGYYRSLFAKDAEDSDEMSEEEKAAAEEKAEKETVSAIEKIFMSPAGIAMVQLQDIFMLGEDARMNVPGTESGNWHWKIPGETVHEAFPDADERAAAIRELAERSGRAGQKA